MSLAIVTEVANRFRKAVAKWNPDPQTPLESRFLIHEGIYLGHAFRLGGFEGRWLSADQSLKIYRDGQWLMTVPLDLEVETVESKVQKPAARTSAGKAA